MQEAILHYVWKHRTYNTTELKLVSAETLSVIHPGQHNDLAGPDFLDARIRIGETLWAGHVEIHINASDWYAHNHQVDPAYENVILHVVWHDNIPVLNKEGIPLPTLELCNYLSAAFLSKYERLMGQGRVFIPCEELISSVDEYVIRAWLDRLYIERLSHRMDTIAALYKDLNANWEGVFFILLAQGFGTRINKNEFREMARQIPYRVLCQVRRDLNSLEALLMGMAGLLEDSGISDPFFTSQRVEFEYLCQKYELNPCPQVRAQYFKLRPLNFPTIRLSQLAQLYHRSPDLLLDSLHSTTLSELYGLFRAGTSPYWETHYIFSKPSASRSKAMSSSFIDTLLINVVLPVKYAYGRARGDEHLDTILDLMLQIPPERNSVLAAFARLGIQAGSAMDSQALLELHTSYCRTKRCLECAIGHRLLGRM